MWRFTLILSLGMSGCSTASVGLHNGTGKAIVDSGVTWSNSERLDDAEGPLGIGMTRTCDKAPWPVPDEVRVTWISGDGESHAKDVSTKQFDRVGYLVFSLRPNGEVRVANLPKGALVNEARLAEAWALEHMGQVAK